MAKTLDEKNKEAPQLNPSRTGGVRSGNPQLDPNSAGKKEGKRTDGKPHAPPAHGEPKR